MDHKVTRSKRSHTKYLVRLRAELCGTL